MKSEKITKRIYDDACGTAHALDLIGERWALLVMRELMFGPRRFGELRGGLPGISANVLTQRLEGLEAAGVVVRRIVPPPASVQVYELTPWGYEAEPILQVAGRWAARSPQHDPTLPISAASIMMSFRTMFDPVRAKGVKLVLAFVVGNDRFVTRVKGGTLKVERGERETIDAIVTAPAEAIAGVVYGGAPIDLLTITGDASAVARFADLFVLPPKA